MHQIISATIQVSFPDEYQEIHSETLIIGKSLSPENVLTKLIQWLANTDFKKHMVHDFECTCNKDSLEKWLNTCEQEHESLTSESPESAEYLDIGTFKSDHKYTNYAGLSLIYERRYLENE